MKRFFITLLLLPSIGICSNNHYHDHFSPEIAQEVSSSIHTHERLNNRIVISRSHRTLNVNVPSYRRYYSRHHRYYSHYWPYRGYYNHKYYHEHRDNYFYNSHVHGHR